MSKEKKVVNREDMIGIISEDTGYTKEVIREILTSESNAKLELIAKGYSYKDLKLGRFDIKLRPEKVNAWDGVNKRRYTIPEQYVIRYEPLKETKDALDILNKSIDN